MASKGVSGNFHVVGGDGRRTVASRKAELVGTLHPWGGDQLRARTAPGGIERQAVPDRGELLARVHTDPEKDADLALLFPFTHHIMPFPYARRSIYVHDAPQSDPALPMCHVEHACTDESMTTTATTSTPLASVHQPALTLRRHASVSSLFLLLQRPIVQQAKGDVYAKALDAARLRGEWESSQPSGTGKDVPWAELIRKYMKHNPNEQVTPSVASVEQQIRTALAAFHKQEDYGDASHLSDSAAFEGQGTTLFPPVLPLDGTGHGWSGDSIAAAIRQLDDLRGSTRDTLTRQTVAALQAFALFITGQDENAVELLHEVRYLDEVDRHALKAGHFTGEYTLALIMMGFAVYGMANERLYEKRKDEGYVPFAFAGYACTIDLHEGLRGGTSAKALRGLPADEIERWGEMALYRHALFSVRYNNFAQGLNALRAYQANAGRWTPNFRVPQRLVIFRTYLAVLNRAIEEGTYKPPPAGVSISQNDCRSAAYQSSVMAVAASRVEVRDFESERTSRMEGGKVNLNSFSTKPVSGSSAPRTTSKRRPAAWRSLALSSAWWTNEFLTAQKTAADCLARTSQFPRAGKVNKAALDLADELIKGWRVNGERGGFEADELVDILYTLSRFTFHSQRISRLLFTLLVAAENYDEAFKALEMYIQVVDKHREGDAADAAGLVEEAKRREAGKDGPTHETGDDDKEGGEKVATLSDKAKRSAEEVHIDADSDEVYIDTLLNGAHMTVRYLDAAREGDRLARKATDLFQRNASLGKDETLIAKIKRVSGAARAAFCRSANDAVLRPAQQDEALSLLKQSLTYDDQSSETYYQLALLQGEMNNVAAAVRSARRAVELEPSHVEYWHLLTLLVSAQKDFRGALRVAEEGLAEAEDDDEADLRGDEGISNGGLTNGSAKNRLTPAASGKRVTLLSVDFQPSARERSESILRLMMTHNALEELVEGAQAAIEAQREIFEFFHRRVASHNHAQRHMAPSTSINGRSDEGTNGLSNGQRDGRGTNRFATLLGGPGQSHNRFHSLTGLGQSGSGHNLWEGARHGLSSKHDGGALGGTGSAATPAWARDEDEGHVPITSAEIRSARHHKEETALLCSLWLMAAATFRRNGNLSECRVAVQEAERVDPANGEVWMQLALWFEQQTTTERVQEPSVALAIQSLYKALACTQDHVGAAVHLARLFISNPLNPHIQDADEPGKPSLKDVASPLPHTTENFHATPLAAELLSRTQSRKISAPTGASDYMAAEQDHDASNPALVQERKRLSTLSMAEGLLVSLTQGQGWCSAEAWLFLSRVMQQTGRPERQRECLEYALQLERSKPIRPLNVALHSGC